MSTETKLKTIAWTARELIESIHEGDSDHTTNHLVGILRARLEDIGLRIGRESKSLQNELNVGDH